MSETYAYVRSAVGTPPTAWNENNENYASDLQRQRTVLQEYATCEGLSIADFIEVSNTGSSRQRRMDRICARLKPGDRLLVTELSTLGSSTGEVIVLLDQLVAAGVAVTVLQPHLHLELHAEDPSAQAVRSVIAHLAQAEQFYHAQRVQKVAAAKKEKGGALGKPKGTVQTSIYDKDRGRIEELLLLGVSQRKIVERHLGYGTSNSLNYYIRTRGLASKPEPQPVADAHTRSQKEKDLVDQNRVDQHKTTNERSTRRCKDLYGSRYSR